MNTVTPSVKTIWKAKPLVWVSLLVALGLLIFLLQDGLINMVGTWGSEEYSHAYLLPFIALFLIWQKKDKLDQIEFNGSWVGLLLVLAGVALFFAGDLATLYVLVQYSFLVVLTGLILAFTGWRGFKMLWVPLLILLFIDRKSVV